MILNPNCSTIVCALPTIGNVKTAEKILAKLYKSDLDQKTKDDMKNILYEWSYDERYEVCTESYPNGAIDDFMHCAEQLKNDFTDFKSFPEPRYVDNLGGGGHWEYVEMCWRIAKLYAFGKLTEDEAKEMDEANGTGPVLNDECEDCLKKNNIRKDCRDYVKRMVGECEGIRERSVNEKVGRLESEVIHAVKS